MRLEGVINFRDFGGARTAVGARVARGCLFRGGALHRATAADRSRLAALGITTVIDLRSDHERSADPIRWIDVVAAPLVSDSVVTGMIEAFRSGSATSEAVEDWWTMTRTARAPEEHRESMRRAIEALMTGRGGIVVQCRGGKDRTGLVAALVLTMLGVPRPAVMADFLLSNAPDPRHDAETSRMLSGMPHLSPRAVESLRAVRPEWLESVLDRLVAEHGSIAGYVAGLGVGEAGVAALRRRYLVPA